MRRLFIGIISVFVLLTSSSKAENGKNVYYTMCYFCHDDGLVGSPIIGDAEEWDKRRKKGLEKLYQNTLSGTGHMMERLDRRGFNKTDIKNAVDYLLEQSK